MYRMHLLKFFVSYEYRSLKRVTLSRYKRFCAYSWTNVEATLAPRHCSVLAPRHSYVFLRIRKNPRFFSIFVFFYGEEGRKIEKFRLKKSARKFRLAKRDNEIIPSHLSRYFRCSTHRVHRSLSGERKEPFLWLADPTIGDVGDKT